MNARTLTRLLSVAILGPALAGVGFAQEREPIVVDAIPPELTGGPWLNTPEKAPITFKSRRGKVTIVHFWTFG